MAVQLKTRDSVVVDEPKTLTPSRLDDLVQHYQGTICDVLVMPALAQHILVTYNTSNRTLHAIHANSFASTLKRGGWMNTGEAVIFSREGILNNGQHRLEGVVRSGIPALMDFRFGIPRAAFAVTDTGAKRLAGDVLSISGISQPFAVAAAIRLVMAYEAGLPGSYVGAIKTGNDQILTSLTRWPDITHAVHINIRTLKRRGFVNASSNAFSFLALRHSNENTVVEFLSIIESGLAKSKFDPPRMLREHLMAGHPINVGGRAAVIERLALFIKAWHLWRNNERARVLRYVAHEPFPSMDVAL